MPTFTVTKVVATLPSTLEPNTIYKVRVGTGYDEYLSDSTGTVAYPQNVGSNQSSTFLPTPDEIDESDETYFYFGWEEVNGSWLVHRQLRSNASTQKATSTSNSAYTNLTTAWPQRMALNFS